MADQDRKLGGVRAGEDPKGSDGRAGEDPKGSDGRAGEDPKGSDGRGASGTNPFGAAGGWGVVAFIGPVGLNIPDLALRALRGETSPTASRMGNPRANALSKLHTIAQNEARKETRQRPKPGAYGPTEKPVKD